MSDTLVTHGQPMAQHGKPMRDAWVTHGYPMATHRMGNPWTSAITQRQSIGDRWVSNIYIYIYVYIYSTGDLCCMRTGDPWATHGPANIPTGDPWGTPG